MSQHYFETVHKEFPIAVLLGWDRPMQHFFLVIKKPADLIGDPKYFHDDEVLYSNLYDANVFGHDLEYFGEVLRHFQIVVPASMFAQVLRDSLRNIGNRVVKHEADGSFAELGA
ncbi:hypothetical protein L683_25320 [Pseudomonas aeruginosa WC55]|uniref:hypothetical protein n=1 Tax=Pseudomonas aeruginosa TaxID=287 RepID=UPI00038F94D9|nr:hypothetical protein [Pseudomonas aeruginosa]EQM83537.1 hypothetical protein L683_25320 [Pseudomonas aeruginosa WC55]MBN8490793.1 hypothetical protein [Burkholderiales bacterium]